MIGITAQYIYGACLLSFFLTKLFKKDISIFINSRSMTQIYKARSISVYLLYKLNNQIQMCTIYPVMTADLIFACAAKLPKFDQNWLL